MPAGSAAACGKFGNVRIKLHAAAGLRHSRAPVHLPMLACRAKALAKAGPQVFFQPGEGGFKGVVVLPAGEIGDVILADLFRQIFAGVQYKTLPSSKDENKRHYPDFARWSDENLLRLS